MVKSIFISLALLVLLNISLSAQPVYNIWEAPYKNGIAAAVEDEIITFEQLRREMAPLIRQVKSESSSKEEFDKKIENLYLDILNSLIDRTLIINEFHKKEFKVPESYVDNEYDEILIKQFNNNRRKFLEHLKLQGKTDREFRNDLKERVIVNIMRGQIQRSQSEVSPERIENFYKENKIHYYQEEKIRLRLIMLKLYQGEPPESIFQTADSILYKLNNGADFSKLAKKYSQDSSGRKGGDWGWVKPSDLREELAEIAFSIEPGKFSSIIELDLQIFILYVEDRFEEGIQSLEDVRDAIENIIASQLARQSQRDWIKHLRKDAYIKFY